LAENLLGLIDGLDEKLFAIGNVAPDSGVPDEKWETFDPPGEVTHFQKKGDDQRRSADLQFYRQYLASIDPQAESGGRFSFLLGYFFHLVTDNLWREQVFLPARERFAAEFESDPRFIWEVKRDWYGLDLEYVRKYPSSLFWRVFLDSQYDQEYLGFLPFEAIRHSTEYIKSFYQRTDEEMEQKYGNRPCAYLSQSEMDRFVEEATARLLQIYQYLKQSDGDAVGLSTALDLPVERRES
jgi:hypothetical protein